MIELLPKAGVYICTNITHLHHSLRAQCSAHTMGNTAKQRRAYGYQNLLSANACLLGFIMHVINSVCLNVGKY